MNEFRIHCRSCGKLAASDDVDLDSMLAKCRDCHAVFGFSDPARRPPTPAKLRRDRGEVPVPEAVPEHI